MMFISYQVVLKTLALIYKIKICQIHQSFKFFYRILEEIFVPSITATADPDQGLMRFHDNPVWLSIESNLSLQGSFIWKLS